MLADKRRHKRQTINRVAKFRCEPTALARDCMITDISDGGARLFCEVPDIPDDFQLLVTGDTTTTWHDCSVVWRLGGELGVRFVTQEREQERLKAFKEVRAKVRNSFGQAS